MKIQRQKLETSAQNVRRLTKRVTEVIRNEGLKSFWFKLLSELGYRRAILFERSLELPPTEIKAQLPVKIDLLKSTQLQDYLALRKGADPAEILNRFKTGSKC